MRKIGEWRIGEKYFKKGHGCWYVELRHPDGHRESRRLDADADTADDLLRDITKDIAAQGTPSPDYAVKDLINLFLAHAEANNAKKTFRWYRKFLRSFAATIPAALKVRDLKLHHVHNWLTRAYPLTGNINTRRGAIVAVRRVFLWAMVDMEYLSRDPLAKLKRPAAVTRPVCLSKDQWATVLKHYPPEDPFHDFLRFMLLTGCRPQEVRIITARHIDWQENLVRFAEREIPGKTHGRDVELTDEAAMLLKKWALKHPEGPVMRNEDGNPWKPSALTSRFRRLKKHLPFNAHCYLARHTVATDLLENGASAGAVAAILGHRDATTVLKTYGSHIDRRRQHLRDCLKKATG
jgi:integrase